MRNLSVAGNQFHLVIHAVSDIKVRCYIERKPANTREGCPIFNNDGDEKSDALIYGFPKVTPRQGDTTMLD